MPEEGAGAAAVSRVAGNGPVEVIRVLLGPEGDFPNNERLPLLVYKGAWKGTDAELSKKLRDNGWDEPWHGHVYPWQHYHDTTWEALVVTRGASRVQFGGPSGPVLDVARGDAVLIPPGVAHHQPGGVPDGFVVAGTYPRGDPPVAELRGPPSDRQRVAIASARMFASDPLFGADGAPWGSPDALLSLPAVSAQS